MGTTGGLRAAGLIMWWWRLVWGTRWATRTFRVQNLARVCCGRC